MMLSFARVDSFALTFCVPFSSIAVILVASMLVSPLMGPILAGVFGHAISNGKLRNLGIKSEIVGLGICIIIGFLLGLIFRRVKCVSMLLFLIYNVLR